MDEQELSRIAEFTEADAYADLMMAVPADLRAQLGLRVERAESLVASGMAAADIALFTRVIGLGVAAPATEEVIDRVLALYAETGVRGMVQLVPGAQPSELPGWLEARGIGRRGNWVKMIRGPEQPLPVQT